MKAGIVTFWDRDEDAFRQTNWTINLSGSSGRQLHFLGKRNSGRTEVVFRNLAKKASCAKGKSISFLKGEPSTETLSVPGFLYSKYNIKWTEKEKGKKRLDSV